jgi:hypothetical protein
VGEAFIADFATLNMAKDPVAAGNKIAAGLFVWRVEAGAIADGRVGFNVFEFGHCDFWKCWSWARNLEYFTQGGERTGQVNDCLLLSELKYWRPGFVKNAVEWRRKEQFEAAESGQRARQQVWKDRDSLCLLPWNHPAHLPPSVTLISDFLRCPWLGMETVVRLGRVLAGRY